MKRSIRNHGERYSGEEISKDDIPGETLVNSFNIYGGGIIIRHRDDVVWLIVNNGADGDAWDTKQHSEQAGQSAYAFSVSVKQIKIHCKHILTRMLHMQSLQLTRKLLRVHK